MPASHLRKQLRKRKEFQNAILNTMTHLESLDTKKYEREDVVQKIVLKNARHDFHTLDNQNVEMINDVLEEVDILDRNK